VSTASIEPLARRFTEIRETTLALAEPLSAEDCAVQSMEDASPTKWHLAHTTWYFETFVLEPALGGYRPFHPVFRGLFNSYYQRVGGQHPRPQRGLLTRPPLSEIVRYRTHVERRVLDWLHGSPEPPLLDLFVLGLHHEQQHQELLLMDIKHAFSCNPLRPAYRALAPPERGDEKPAQWSAWSGGLAEIGHRGGSFGFDNEFPCHRVCLEPFEIASRLATNGEYLAFMSDGGYRRPELWLSDGWALAERAGWQSPLYWQRDGENWQEFTLAGMRPLRAESPVAHLSYYEADAFARWSGARLPSEAEWEVWAVRQPSAGNFLESGHLHPIPARPSSTEDGPSQLFGDLWEWTRTAYGPYPGYRVPAGAVGEYNGKFMCNQLSLRGGACVTPADHIRATYRNFFYPHQRWEFAGVRLARDTA
jgi:ergothioneine biosynthesis protein EgtB